MAKVNVICSNCKSANTIKAGVDKLKSCPDGVQKYTCKDCGKHFRLKYKAIGRLPETKEQIVDMCNNGSGIRDTARVLKISTKTVVNTIKKSL